MWYRDSNSQPPERYSPPITTRPVLPLVTKARLNLFDVLFAIAFNVLK